MANEKQEPFNDSKWVRSLFRLKDEEIDEKHGVPIELRYWSSSDIKFTDTSLGGNMCINPLAQPCKFTDPPKEYALTSAIGGDGMS